MEAATESAALGGGTTIEEPPAEAPSAGSHPVRPRELLALGIGLVAADICLFAAGGYMGEAVFLIALPLVLMLGTYRRQFTPTFACIHAMLVLLALRQSIQGSEIGAAMGAALAVLLVMSLAGVRPFFVESMLFLCGQLAAAPVNLARYLGATGRRRGASRGGIARILVPAVLAGMFGTLFVLANPDMRAAIAARLRDFFRHLDVLPSMDRAIFWVLAALALSAAFRPIILDSIASIGASDEDLADPAGVADNGAYAVASNTLGVLVALFAAYLCYEFATLWFREVPAGFHYAGYAHEGAAWLTAALVLATLVIGACFHSGVYGHPKFDRLKRLAWAWAMLNGLLGLAVYHRLLIYVNYNGLSVMRLVGYAGITLVLAGFGLAVAMVAGRRRMLWLVQRQVVAAFLAVYALVMLPLDWIAARHNVARIMAGERAPLVQIVSHPASPQAIQALLPLLSCPDATIARGMQTWLQVRFGEFRREHAKRRDRGWGHHQFALSRAVALPGKMEQWSLDRQPSTLDIERLDEFQQMARQFYH